jgi:Uma2 family endonuclease
MQAATEENTIVIDGVSWDAYLQMDELLGDAPVRMKWSDECLEIMSPISRHHELIKSNIARMIELFCRRKGIFFQITGSATLRKERQRGGEPDDSYIFTRGQESTDLVVEAALSSGGIDKLEFYLPLEIPEVWVWQRGALRVHALRAGKYMHVESSQFLPGLDVSLIERLAEHPYTSDALNEFESELVKGNGRAGG